MLDTRSLSFGIVCKITPDDFLGSIVINPLEYAASVVIKCLEAEAAHRAALDKAALVMSPQPAIDRFTDNSVLGIDSLHFYCAAMRRVWALAAYLGLVFVAGGLLAPWLYWFTAWLAESVPSLAGAAAAPFHRFVHRALLLAALAGLIPLLRYLRINSWRDVGLRPQNGWQKQVATGFGWGCMSLGGLAATAMLFGARALANKPLETIFKGLAFAAITAVLVAVLEELLFRGVFFGGLRRVRNWIGAMLISSGIYSIVHFFQRPAIQPADITWLSGLKILPVMARGFGAVEILVPGFFVLLIAGMILATAYQRTSTLYFSIGLHAGWIFWQKSYGLLTSPSKVGNQTFWGSYKIIDGWASLIVLLFLLAWLLRPAEALGNLRTQPIVKRA